MAGNIDSTKIHVGPGRLWLNVCAPMPGTRLTIDTSGIPQVKSWANGLAVPAGYSIVDSNGNMQEVISTGVTSGSPPTWGTTVYDEVVDGSVTWRCVALSPTYVFVGASEGDMTVTLTPKNAEIMADQATAGIDAFMSAEVESIEATLLESDLAKMRNYLTHGTYTTGTDPSLPSGAQSYEDIAFGGVLTVPKISIAMISPRRDVIGKYVVAQLYRGFQSDEIKLPVTRTKPSSFKVKFTGLWDDYRPNGDRVGRIYRQL